MDRAPRGAAPEVEGVETRVYRADVVDDYLRELHAELDELRSRAGEIIDAHRHVEEIVAAAERHAQRRVAAAEDRARHLLTAAAEHARRLVSTAEGRARALGSSSLDGSGARAEAQRLIAQAHRVVDEIFTPSSP